MQTVIIKDKKFSIKDETILLIESICKQDKRGFYGEENIKWQNGTPTIVDKIQRRNLKVEVRGT